MLDALTFDAGSTLTPDYMLMLDSRDITGNISDRLMSMTLTDNRGFEADQLDIELNDADGLVELPLRGAVLALFIGWKGEALTDKGRFTVDEIEHRVGLIRCLLIGKIHPRIQADINATRHNPQVQMRGHHSAVAPGYSTRFDGVKTPDTTVEI